MWKIPYSWLSITIDRELSNASSVSFVCLVEYAPLRMEIAEIFVEIVVVTVLLSAPSRASIPNHCSYSVLGLFIQKYILLLRTSSATVAHEIGVYVQATALHCYCLTSKSGFLDWGCRNLSWFMPDCSQIYKRNLHSAPQPSAAGN